MEDIFSQSKEILKIHARFQHQSQTNIFIEKILSVSFYTDKKVLFNVKRIFHNNIESEGISVFRRIQLQKRISDAAAQTEIVASVVTKRRNKAV